MMNTTPMPATRDTTVVERCLSGASYAWEDFVDTFIEPLHAVVVETARRRGHQLDEDGIARLLESVFRAFHYNNFQLLREFEKRAAATTYLAIVARRLVVACLDSNSF